MRRASLWRAALVVTLAHFCHAVNVKQSAQVKQSPISDAETAVLDTITATTGLEWNFEATPCECSLCVSEKLPTVPENPDRVTLYYGCSKKADVVHDQCTQSDDLSQRVLNTDILDVAQWCIYTCKPVLQSTPGGDHKCEMLDEAMIEKARTDSGGQAFMWASSLMTDSNTFADIPPAPSMISVLDAMRKTYVKSLHGPPPMPEPEVFLFNELCFHRLTYKFSFQHHGCIAQW